MADFEQVSCNIRSCLTSSKSKLSLSQLSHDYQSVLCDTIPYRQLGFQSLEALIRAVKKIRVFKVGNEVYVGAEPNEKTAHIADLVQGQKQSKNKKKKKTEHSYRAQPAYRPSYVPSSARNGYHPTKRPVPPPRRSELYPKRARNSPPKIPIMQRSLPATSKHDHRVDQSYEKYKRSRREYSEKYKCQPTQHEYCEKYESQPTQHEYSDRNEFNNDTDDYCIDTDDMSTKMEELRVTTSSKHRKVQVNKEKTCHYQTNTPVDDNHKPICKIVMKCQLEHYHRIRSTYDDVFDQLTPLQVTSSLFEVREEFLLSIPNHTYRVVEVVKSTCPAIEHAKNSWRECSILVNNPYLHEQLTVMNSRLDGLKAAFKEMNSCILALLPSSCDTR